MRSDAFDITYATVTAGGSRGGECTTIVRPAEVIVTPLNALTPGCVTIMLGTRKKMAGDEIALWIDFERDTALRVSDGMLSALASGKAASIKGTARAEAWDHKGGHREAGTVYFEVQGEKRTEHPDVWPWTISTSRRGADGVVRRLDEMRFQVSDARVLAELLRQMPLR